MMKSLKKWREAHDMDIMNNMDMNKDRNILYNKDKTIKDNLTKLIREMPSHNSEEELIKVAAKFLNILDIDSMDPDLERTKHSLKNIKNQQDEEKLDI